MFYNGVYSRAEQEMLEQWNAKAEKDVGWLGDDVDYRSLAPCNIRQADEEIIRLVARNHDYKNRLYRDLDYAKASRWGNIIAPPMFMPCVGYGCGHFMMVPPEAGVYVGQHFGEEFDYDRPIYAGDTLRVFQGRAVMKDETPEGGSDIRILASYDKKYYYNQNNERVGVFNHIVKHLYSEPGTEYGKVMRYGFEGDFGLGASFQNVRWTQPFRYTRDQIDAINQFYLNEVRRGRQTLYWEDVNVGDELPSTVLGPITLWDAVGAIATHAESNYTMMEFRRNHMGGLFIDPATGVPHQGAEIHLSMEIPKLINWYSSTIVEHTIISACCRLVSNWMSDDGFITHVGWRKFANTQYGDTLISRGRVVRKYIDENGDCLVDVDTALENLRGFLTNMCPITVKLPSRAKELYEQAPEDPKQPSLELNPQHITAGDRFQVKPRPDWEFPGGDPLEGKTGVVFELPLDYDGYVYALLDEGCTGLDPRVVVGFRMDQIEKL